MDIAAVIALVTTVLAATWRLATPLIYASVGELFTERSGVLNIGLEGIMLFGAFAGFAAGIRHRKPSRRPGRRDRRRLVDRPDVRGLHSEIKANQIVVGAAINMIGLGLTGFLYRTLFDVNTKAVKTFRARSRSRSSARFRSSATSSSNRACWSTPRLIVVPLAAFLLYRTRLRPRGPLGRRTPEGRRHSRHQRDAHPLCLLVRSAAHSRPWAARFSRSRTRTRLSRGWSRAAGSLRWPSSCSVAGSRGASSAHRCSSASSTGCSSICRR